MGYLDNAGLARFWSDIKDVLLGPGSRTSATDDADTVAKGIYYWDLLSRKPLHTPSNISEGILICIGGNSAVTSRVQFMIPMMNNVGGDDNDTDIFFRIYDRVAGWESWRKFQTTDKYDTSPVANSGDAITSGAVYTALSEKQNALTFDGTYDSSDNPAATVSTVTDAIAALELGSASKRNITTTITSGSANLLTSGGAYTNLPKISLRRGTEISSTPSSPANLDDYTTAGRYYTTKAGSTATIKNSPMKALGLGDDTYVTIDGVRFQFNANMELIVEELAQFVNDSGTVTSTYVMQTVIYTYNSTSANPSAGVQKGRSFVRSHVFRRMKDAYEWSNWHMYTGTEIVPPTT